MKLPKSLTNPLTVYALVFCVGTVIAYITTDNYNKVVWFIAFAAFIVTALLEKPKG